MAKQRRVWASTKNWEQNLRMSLRGISKSKSGQKMPTMMNWAWSISMAMYQSKEQVLTHSMTDGWFWGVLNSIGIGMWMTSSKKESAYFRRSLFRQTFMWDILNVLSSKRRTMRRIQGSLYSRTATMKLCKNSNKPSQWWPTWKCTSKQPSNSKKR